MKLHNEMCQHVEDLDNSMNQYFPNEHRMVKNRSIQSTRQTSEF